MSTTPWRRVPLIMAAVLALLASAVAPASPVAAAGPRPAKGPDPGAEVTPIGGVPRTDQRPDGERVSTQATVSTNATVRAVSAGEGITCAIRADETIGCWGWFVDWAEEDFAQVQAPPGTFKSLGVGATLACAIRPDDSVTCWGMDTANQLDVPSGQFSAVTAGDRHACAIRGDGTVACWGANDNFQATPPADTFIAVDAGDGFTCGVRADGTLACWGYNGNNQSTPPSGTFKAVSAGSAHACAIRANNTVACWGYNGSNRSVPPQGTFAAVSAGGEHTCALRDTGLVECWGNNDAGQSTEPAAVHVSVTAGGYHACGMREDARLDCWGSNEWGEVVPAPVARLEALPAWTSDTATAVTWSGEPALAPVASFDVRYVSTAWNSLSSTTTTWKSATTATSATFDATPGTSYCFSVRVRDTEGRLSDWTDRSCMVVPLDDRSLGRSGTWTLGSDPGAFRSTLVQSTTPGATLTRSGLRTARIALLATMCPTCGTVQLSWSGSTAPFRTVSLAAPVTVQRRFLPVLDDYSETSRTLVIKVVTSGRPVIIDGLLTTLTYEAPGWVSGGNPPVPAAITSQRTVSGLAASFDGSCAVRSDHTVACWGNNDDGKAVAPAGTYLAVAQGDYHTCAIATTDGTLACWGYDWDGELTPPEGGPYTAIAAGAWDTCAIRDGGQVDCWGYGASYAEWSAPQGTFTAIAATRNGFCGLTTEGSLECWGNDYEYGDLTHPEGSFKAVAGRCAIREDGTVTCWGGGGLGQDDPPDGTFKALATGGLHTCGIRTDDTLACWGDDNYLEASPPAGTFKAVVAGWAHACATAMDDTLACWGHDGSSQVVPRPIAGVQRLGSWTTTPTVPLAWAATGLAPIATYDVRYRKATWNGAFGTAVGFRTGTTAMTASMPGTAGATYCVSARATDADGRVSAWTAETCTGFPLDDRSLSRAGSWTRGTGSAYYRSTYVKSTANGATLTRTGVSTRRISLVATTCSTCGKVNVYWGTKLLKTIDLRSSTTVTRKVFSVATFSSVRTGTLKIKVITSGKKVIIDGVGLRRD